MTKHTNILAVAGFLVDTAIVGVVIAVRWQAVSTVMANLSSHGKRVFADLSGDVLTTLHVALALPVSAKNKFQVSIDTVKNI